MSTITLDEVYREIKLVRERMERLEELVEERLIGSEEPTADEVKAIEEYQESKRKGDLKLIPLSEVE